jgi:cellulose synthase/poly-beta-1,6-N-acetylglucosamine synthase-like glycosyltransferase
MPFSGIPSRPVVVVPPAPAPRPAAVARFRIGELLLACGIPRERLLDEARRAQALGSDLIDLGLNEGWIDEGVLLSEVAARVDAIALDDAPMPERGTDIPESLKLCSFRARLDGSHETVRVISPNGALIRAMGEGKFALPAGRIVLVPRQSLIDALLLEGAERLSKQASSTLPECFSARPRSEYAETARRAAMTAATLTMGIVLVMLLVEPAVLVAVIPLLLGSIFVLAALCALAAAAAAWPDARAAKPLADAELPRYTLLVPLYREARVLDALIARLGRIDYPRDRLEILLLVEQDDRETRDAINQRKKSLPRYMSVLVIPPGQPRTKPRALNAALPFATGNLLVVYDAEDAPEADQLRRAAAAFAASPREITCLQARLAIANPYDGWLAWRFAVDYAALFDTIKAGSARLGLPVPLGGSSNHFRLEVLRRVGAWDAWNVTEDADLGIRLARFHHRVDDLPSTTWEEAPTTLGLWLNQRTRWMKGWMQTALVQARAPRDLLGELGPFRALTISLIGLSVVLGALLLPLVVLAFILRIQSDLPVLEGNLFQRLADATLIMSLAMALLLETIPPLMALAKRRSLRLAPAILFAPVIYALISFCAWRGLIELITRPYHWHKTPHGLMKSEGGVGDLRGVAVPDTKPSEAERPEPGHR